MKKTAFCFFLTVWISTLLFLGTQPSFAQELPSIWPGTEWKISTPEEQRINSIKLDEMYADESFTGNMLLVRSGYLVSEKYNQEKGKKYAPHIFSCTKGIISALIGIALNKRNLTSIHQNVLDFFPEYKRPNRDEQKKQITLYHLLTMTSGLYWTDSLSTRIIYNSPDWNLYILDQPMEAAPGTHFN